MSVARDGNPSLGQASALNSSRSQDRSSRNPCGKRDFLIRKANSEGVGLTLMSDGMSKRKINMTNYNQKKNCLQWSVELVFPGCEPEKDSTETELNSRSPKPFSHLIHQISSDTPMREVLKRMLNLKKLKLTKDRRLMLLNLLSQHDSNQDEDDLIFVMRVEWFSPTQGTPPDSQNLQTEVYVIEPGVKLCEALNGTQFLEWPRIEVWPTFEWTAEISSGRVKILPKQVTQPSGPFRKPPVDSGWSNKRLRKEASCAPTDTVHDEDAAIRVKYPGNGAPVPAANLDEPNSNTDPSDTPPDSIVLLKSLLQYSSSDDE